MRVEDHSAVGEEAGVDGTSEAAGAVPTPIADRKVCGSVARLAAAGSFGRNNEPFWPQAARPTAPIARISALTRILRMSNIAKL